MTIARYHRNRRRRADPGAGGSDPVANLLEDVVSKACHLFMSCSVFYDGFMTAEVGAPIVKWFRKLMPREDRFFDLFARAFAHNGRGGRSAERLACRQGYGTALSTHHRARRRGRRHYPRGDWSRSAEASSTPFDRGDIKDLIMSMDDAIDMMHKTVKTIRLFEAEQLRSRHAAKWAASSSRPPSSMAEAIPLLDRMAANAQRLGVLTEEGRVTQVEGRSDETARPRPEGAVSPPRRDKPDGLHYRQRDLWRAGEGRRPLRGRRQSKSAAS